MLKENIVFLILLVVTSTLAAPKPFIITKNVTLPTLCESVSELNVDENRIPKTITHVKCAEDCKGKCPPTYACGQLVTKLDVKDKRTRIIKNIDVLSGCACQRKTSQEGRIGETDVHN